MSGLFRFIKFIVHLRSHAEMFTARMINERNEASDFVEICKTFEHVLCCARFEMHFRRIEVNSSFERLRFDWSHKNENFLSPIIGVIETQF